MIEVGFADLHKPLFVGGKNHGERLDCGRFPDLKMVYFPELKELHVTWGGTTTHVPSTNIANYTPGPAKNRRVVQSAAPQVAGVAFTAQVETPMSHVHAGHGHGKTGKSK